MNYHNAWTIGMALVLVLVPVAYYGWRGLCIGWAWCYKCLGGAQGGFVRRNLIDSDPCPERTHPKVERYNPADDADHVCYGGTLYDVQTRRLS